MKINVTKRDIKLGVRYNIFSCPVARALKRSKKDPNCWAGRISMGWTYHLCDTPQGVAQWMLAFDRGEEVKPFSFEIYG